MYFVAYATEYAAPSRELPVADPYLLDLQAAFPYVTRLNTVISPEEMTVDPLFAYDPNARDVSNIHDPSGMRGLCYCEREAAASDANIVVPFIGPLFSGGDDGEGQSSTLSSPGGLSVGVGEVLILGIFLGGGLVVALVAGAVAIGWAMGRRTKG